MWAALTSCPEPSAPAPQAKQAPVRGPPGASLRKHAHPRPQPCCLHQARQEKPGARHLTGIRKKTETSIKHKQTAHVSKRGSPSWGKAPPASPLVCPACPSSHTPALGPSQPAPVTPQLWLWLKNSPTHPGWAPQTPGSLQPGAPVWAHALLLLFPPMSLLRRQRPGLPGQDWVGGKGGTVHLLPSPPNAGSIGCSMPSDLTLILGLGTG